MSNGTQVEAEQLFDSPTPEVAATATDTEETQENLQGEQEQEGLKLDESLVTEVRTPDKAEEAKLAQIKKWQSEIDNGSKTIADLPPAQSWLKSHLVPNVQDIDPVDSKESAREMVKEAMKEERERADFARLKDTLNDLATAEQKRTLEEKFKALVKKGLNLIDALELATELAGVDMTGASEKRRRMVIPQPGSNFNVNTADIESMPFEEAVKIFPKEKIAEHLRKMVAGR